MIRIYRCFPKKNILILTGLYFLFAMHAQAACTVTQDDGRTYTDTSVSNCGSYYPELHYDNYRPARAVDPVSRKSRSSVAFRCLSSP